MTLALNSPYTKSMSELHGNSDRLYYGYRTFSVAQKGISRICIDMVRSYYSLGLTIKWKTKAPENTGDFYILYKDIPSEYHFMPGTISKKGDWETHDPNMDDHSTANNEIIYHTAGINTKKLATHRFDVKMNIDKRIETEFITYRHQNNTHPLLSIYAGSNQIMKEIDLERFFRSMDIELDNNLEQEFNVLIEIDGDNVNIQIANTNDWEEGGIIG